MSKLSAKASSGDLFARKGSAKPAGQLIAYERFIPNDDTPDLAAKGGEVTATDGTDSAPRADSGLGDDLKSDATDENGTTAGSVFSIEFRKQVSEGEARGSQIKPGPPNREVPNSPANMQRRIRASLQDPEAERRKPLRFSTPTDHVSATLEPVGPASVPPRGRGDESTRHGLTLSLVAVGCLMVGAWFAFEHWKGKATPAPDSAVPPKAIAAIPATAIPADETLDGAEAKQPADAEQPLAAVQPSFDLIRVEPDGEAVIAGRAAPNAELILLDNGEPIGTITANWAGEWAYIPETPLKPGNHQFALVVKTPQGTVTLPAPAEDGSAPQSRSQGDVLIQGNAPDAAETPKAASRAPGAEPEETELTKPEQSRPAEAEPATEESLGLPGVKSDRQSGAPAQDLPVPPHKPALKELAILGDGGPTHYMIQLSSTHSQTGAQKEWVKLRRVFPNLLDGMELNVHKANVETLGTRYRVRTGQFVNQGRAWALCQKFQTLDQECLVIKR